MAVIIATISREYAEGKVVVLVVTAKGNKLYAVQEFGSAIGIAEIPVVFVIRQLRKCWGWARASRLRRRRAFRGLRRLRRSADTRDQHEQAGGYSDPCQAGLPQRAIRYPACKARQSNHFMR